MHYGILYLFVQLLYMFIVNLTSYPWIPEIHIVVTPIFHVWYLLSLTYWYLISVFLKKFRLHPLTVLVTTIIFALFIRYINFHADGNYFAYERTIVFAPYFIAGYFFTFDKLIKVRAKLRKFKPVLFFVMIISVCINFLSFGNNANEWMRVFFGYVNYYQFDDGKYIFFLKELIQYIIGTIAIALLLGLVSKRKSFLSYIGQHTLYIFICHPIIYFIVYNRIDRKSMDTVESFLVSTALTILAIIFSLAIEQILFKIKYFVRNNN
nr:acyltransferase family protein [Enterococcus pingfangensis]